MNNKKFTFTLAEGATHVDMLPVLAKAGFTLAEVLITLGIIGVVSAMTIPNLMTNYKAIRMQSQFKKSYSTVAQALRLMIADDDSIERGVWGSYENVYQKFMNYISGTLVCDFSGNSIPDAQKVDVCSPGWSSSYKNLKGEGRPDAGVWNKGQLVLQDGTLLLFDDGPTGEGFKGCPIYIDINGYKQGPNRLGYDLFAFEIVENSLLPQGHLQTKYAGKVDENCNVKAASSSGWTCATKAMENTDYFKLVVRNAKAK